jgi:hypothetical protein
MNVNDTLIHVNEGHGITLAHLSSQTDEAFVVANRLQALSHQLANQERGWT